MFERIGGLMCFVILLVLGVITIAVVAIHAAINTPSSGTVHDKRYSAAYTSTFCHHTGNATICSPEYHPERWSLDLYNGSKHGWVNVSENAYESVHIGSFYDTKE